MKILRLIPIASAVLLVACTTREMNTGASNTARVATYPVTGPARAISDNMDASETTEYIYFKKVPGTNTFTKIVSKKLLTLEEQRAQGIYVHGDAE